MRASDLSAFDDWTLASITRYFYLQVNYLHFWSNWFTDPTQTDIAIDPIESTLESLCENVDDAFFHLKIIKCTASLRWTVVDGGAHAANIIVRASFNELEYCLNKFYGASEFNKAIFVLGQQTVATTFHLVYLLNKHFRWDLPYSIWLKLNEIHT